MQDTILQGDCLQTLRQMPAESVQCCVTSPPYFGLRDYGAEGQIGLEPTPEQYVAKLVDVFREVRRVLRKDGVLFLNLGDSYYHSTPSGPQGKKGERAGRTFTAAGAGGQREGACGTSGKAPASYPNRDLSFESLCGVCLSVWESRISHTSLQREATQVALPSDPNRAHKESERGRLPTLDSSRQKQTRQSSDAKQDLTHSEGHANALPRASLASMSGVSSLQSQDCYLQTSNDGVDLPSVGSFAGDARPSDDRSDAPLEMPRYMAGNALSCEQQKRHIRCTAGYCSHCGTYSDFLLTNIQPHYTTRLSSKQLLGMPWRVAFALQADGWILRSDCIWHKPNCMPESVKDRPTKAHEYMFLFAKSERYYYDAQAIAEPSTPAGIERSKYAYGGKKSIALVEANKTGIGVRTRVVGERPTYFTRNRRTVWSIPTHSYSGAHFATFPPALIEPCILAGSSPQACEVCGAPWERMTAIESRVQGVRGSMPSHFRANVQGYPQQSGISTSVATLGWQPTCRCDNTGSARCIVLDPFFGAGTVGVVARQHNRHYLGCELNAAYIALAEARIAEAVKPRAKIIKLKKPKPAAAQASLWEVTA